MMWLFWVWLSLNHNVVKVHPLCNVYQNVIPLYDWKLIFLCTCHILFIHSCIDGHLSYFYCSVIKNNTAMSICVWGLEHLFSVLWGVVYTWEPELLDEMVISWLIPWRNHPFSAALNCDIPTSSVWRFQSSASLSVLVTLKIITILVGVKWCLLMSLLCTSLATNDVDHIFSIRACWLFCISSLEKCCWSFFPWVVRVACIFWILTLIR